MPKSRSAGCGSTTRPPDAVARCDPAESPGRTSSCPFACCGSACAAPSTDRERPAPGSAPAATADGEPEMRAAGSFAPLLHVKVVRNDTSPAEFAAVWDHFPEDESTVIHHGHLAPKEMAPRAARTARARP